MICHRQKDQIKASMIRLALSRYSSDQMTFRGTKCQVYLALWAGAEIFLHPFPIKIKETKALGRIGIRKNPLID